MMLTAPSWRTKEEQMANAYILATDLAKIDANSLWG